MDLLVAMKGVDTMAWVSALEEEMPEADIRLWTPGDDARADYVLFWKEQAAALNKRADVKAVFNMGAGVDALLALLSETEGTIADDVPIIRLEDAGMAQQMVEYAIYCTLRFQRGFYLYEHFARSGTWHQFDAHPAESFVVGVMGAGQLGQPVAVALANLGFPVRLFSRSEKSVPGVTTFAGMESLHSFASGTKLLINLLPNTPETVGILNARLFSAMDAGGYVVNLARGSHVVDADLLHALESGQLARVALDVFRQEPLPADHPFWAHAQVDMTPHISARTLVRKSVKQVAAKIRSHQDGNALIGLDLKRGY